MTKHSHEKRTGLFSDPAVHGTQPAMRIDDIMARIKIATPESQIMVYAGYVEGVYTTAFATTVQGMIDAERGYSKHGERVVGVWDRTSSEATILAVLGRAK